MLGTIVNCIVVIVGSILGIILKKGINEKYTNTIIDGVSLGLIVVGIMGGIKTNNLVLLIISLALGGLIGEAIDIEGGLIKFGKKIENRFAQGDSYFAKAFVSATLVFCVGAMAIVGSIESGLTGNHEILFAKSTMDGIFAIIFAANLGIGTAFAAIPVFIYQGSMTLLAIYLKDILTPELINEMSAIGGILIIGIGINMLNIKKIKVGNLLPAVFIPLIYFFAINFFEKMI